MQQPQRKLTRFNEWQPYDTCDQDVNRNSLRMPCRHHLASDAIELDAECNGPSTKMVVEIVMSVQSKAIRWCANCDIFFF